MIDLGRPVCVHSGNDAVCVAQVDFDHRNLIENGTEVRVKTQPARPLHTQHLNTLFDEEFGEIGAILATDTRD